MLQENLEPEDGTAAFSPFLGADEHPPIRSNAFGVPALARRAALQAWELLGARRSNRWRREDPGSRFSNYYASRIAARLARGGAHKTLGGTEWPARKVRGQRERVEQLRRWGLNPHHRVVDYGCGSLRIGQHLIRYLDPENYVGLDVTDLFFQAGIDLLGDQLLHEKRPQLSVIDPDVVSALENDPPDFVLSNAVLYHVHPSELDSYLSNILRMTGSNTQSFVTFKEWKRNIQTAGKSWAYAAHDLVERIAALDPRAEVTFQRRHEPRGRWDPSWKSTIRIVRPRTDAGGHPPQPGDLQPAGRSQIKAQDRGSGVTARFPWHHRRSAVTPPGE